MSTTPLPRHNPTTCPSIGHAARCPGSYPNYQRRQAAVQRQRLIEAETARQRWLQDQRGRA